MFHSFDELSTTGALWFVNSVLHERGIAIALVSDGDGRAVGWTLAPAAPFDAQTNAVKSAAFEALCAQIGEPATQPAPATAQEPAPASLAEIVAAVVAQLGQSGALTPDDSRGSVAAALTESPATPTTIGADLGSVMRGRPVFARASFVASHASNADPNPVSREDGAPNDGVRW